MTRLVTRLETDDRAPMRLYPPVLRALAAAARTQAGYTQARRALQWLARRPHDAVENLGGFLAVPPPAEDDFQRGFYMVHPSVFQEIEWAFAEGRTGDAAQALDWLAENRRDDMRALLDLSSEIKPRLHDEDTNLFRVKVPRELLYQARVLYANGLRETADAILTCLLNDDEEGARRAAKSVAPGDMEQGGFGIRQVNAQLQAEAYRDKLSAAINRLADTIQPGVRVEVESYNSRPETPEDRKVENGVKITYADQSEVVLSVPKGQLEKVFNVVNEACNPNVRISPTMAHEGQQGRIFKEAFVNSQVLIHNARRLLRSILEPRGEDDKKENGTE